jgi:hypothetical protein
MGEFAIEQKPLIEPENKILNVSEIVVGAGDTAFRVNQDGATIPGLNSGSLLDIQGWAFSGTFSATDSDTVAWTAGTLTFGDGTSFSIDAGNTGNMAAITYIYFSQSASTTVLQTTTTAATAVGANKVLICTAKNETAKNATFQAFNSKGTGVLITADNIAASTITANEIATNTITANKMSISELSAIVANCGTITAGTITGATIRTAAPAAGVGSSVSLVGGSNEMVRFYYNATQQAFIRGYTTEGSEETYLRVEATSGRYILFKNSYISCDGNFLPSGDNDFTMGSSDRRWSDGRFEDITVDDLVVNQSFDPPGYGETNLLTVEQKSEFKRIKDRIPQEDEIAKVVNDEKLKREDAYKKLQKQFKKDSKTFNITGFEKGSLMSWGANGLELSNENLNTRVIAVADHRGMPIVMGAEPIKVIGKVKIHQFLVASNTAGCARALETEDPPRGAIIAQALEDKKSTGVGLINAMISRM